MKAKRAALTASAYRVVVAKTRFAPPRASVVHPGRLVDFDGLVIRNVGLRDIYVEVA